MKKHSLCLLLGAALLLIIIGRVYAVWPQVRPQVLLNLSCTEQPTMEQEPCAKEGLDMVVAFDTSNNTCVSYVTTCLAPGGSPFATVEECQQTCGGEVPSTSGTTRQAETDAAVSHMVDDVSENPLAGDEVGIPLSERDVCTGEPIITGIGSALYPVSDGYRHIGGYLGALLGATDCNSAERVAEQWGVQGGMFTQGSHLQLIQTPSAALIDVLHNIGYVCQESESTEVCTDWKLNDVVTVEQISRLKPYAAEIESNDCVLCG